MPTILIIDDNDDLRDTLVVLLEDQGYSVIAAGDGTSGLRAFELARPDLVLTDVIMPDSDGIDAIRRIRAVDPKARIVAMSGGSMTGNDYQLRMAKEAGAIEALSKPFEVDESGGCRRALPQGLARKSVRPRSPFIRHPRVAPALPICRRVTDGCRAMGPTAAGWEAAAAGAR